MVVTASWTFIAKLSANNSHPILRYHIHNNETHALPGRIRLQASPVPALIVLH